MASISMIPINPATDAALGRIETHSAAELDLRLQAAAKTQRAWCRRSVADRARLLRDVAAALLVAKERYAQLITLEMGKAIRESRAEIDKCAMTCNFYADNIDAMLADDVVESTARDSRVVFDSIGVVLAVMPWNYPFWQAIRATVPALAVGNAVVLKHASNVPQCALALQEVFADAGALPGLFTTLLAGSQQVQALIEDRRVAAVTFTGSTPVGRILASQAGRALKKQVLELGGSDPFIVLADADIATAAAAAAQARFHNAGQSCISPKRFIVEASVADEFADALCAAARKLVVGDPTSSLTDMGPMARGHLRDELHVQVEATIGEGAKLRIGGRPMAGRGYFYAPTVMDRVEPGMTLAREEGFGPVAAIMRVRSADEAVAVANGTDFGLGAALWTSDVANGQATARELHAGAVFVNGVVASDPRLPFGGVKQSGYGRELGAYGLREFANVKTVWTGPARA